MIYRLIMVSLFIALSGCSSVRESMTDSVTGWFSDKDNAEPPAKLVDFKASISVSQRWSASVGSNSRKLYVRLQPKVDGDRIYAAGAKGRVSAFEVTSGQLLWRVDTELPIRGGPGSGDGLVLLGTADAEVIALDRNSGAERWRAKVSSEVLASPAAAEGVTVVRSIDGRIYGLSSEDGKRIWTYDSSVPVLTLRGTSAPVIINGGVIAGLSNGKLVALLLKNGAPLWESRIAIPSGRSELERIVDIDADPIVANGVVHVATYQGNIATVALENGRGLWNRKMSSHAGIGADSNILYVTDANSEVWALDRRSGSSYWKLDQLRARKLSAPVAYGDYVVVADFEGYVHFINRNNGAFAARVRVGSSPIVAAPIVAGDTVFISSSAGELTALRIGG
ncbi:outer membrane protein assembly factor BamB [Sulfuriflexus mobilis]|uniref:outer membrane protein assembly factor BamB n=1 Tax=Sulfuriflexus mobilis TaxID=1811807 RepID=UPI000F838AE5|nr:outer membrane protein assembly factor BamB [Sulfuriflexus mobilis]